MEELMILVGVIGVILSFAWLRTQKKAGRKVMLPVAGICVSLVLLIAGLAILIQVGQTGGQ